MSILQDIVETITSGAVSEPFSAEDLAHALRDKDWSRGSYATLLSRHARSQGGLPCLFVRVGPGRYRLAPNARIPERKAQHPLRAAHLDANIE